MTKEVLLEILANEGVRFNRVNGFSISTYQNEVLLKGRIPLGLARKLREGVDTRKLQISIHGGGYLSEPENWATNSDLADIISEIVYNLKKYPEAEKVYSERKAEYIRKAEQAGKLDDIYVLYIHLGTPEAVKHAIHIIRESGYVNMCLWD